MPWSQSRSSQSAASSSFGPRDHSGEPGAIRCTRQVGHRKGMEVVLEQEEVEMVKVMGTGWKGIWRLDGGRAPAPPLV